MARRSQLAAQDKPMQSMQHLLRLGQQRHCDRDSG